VHLALHNTNPNPLVEGPALELAPVHSKVPWAGYCDVADEKERQENPASSSAGPILPLGPRL